MINNEYIKEQLQLNEHNRSEGYLALNIQDVYVNYTAEYELSSLEHMHNSHEILFVEEGIVEYIINNEKYLLKKNEILIIGATDLHKMNILKAPYIRYGLSILPSYMLSGTNLQSFHKLLRTHSAKDSEQLKRWEKEEFISICKLLYNVKREINNMESLGKEMVDAYLMTILIPLYRKMKLSDHEDLDNDIYHVMRNICYFLNEHFVENISLDSLSKMFYLHPCTISRAFSKYYGKKFNTYLNSIRIAYSIQLLEKTDMSITEIGDKSGYRSINTFLRRFHSAMGISPLQYRKNHQKTKFGINL